MAVSIDCGNEGQIVWFASADLLDDTYNSYSSGANLDLGMNTLSSLMGEREAVAIRSKSLSYNYLTISESTSPAKAVKKDSSIAGQAIFNVVLMSSLL